jgi:hypothetical protein
MILNTGMRTDIPAYFPLWFANRLDAGYVLVRNPYNPLQVTRYRLDPSVVDILCFGSKNPAPILPYLDKIKKFRTFWFVTMNPYGIELEPNVPPWQEVAQTIRVLAGTFGKRAVCWRVSPVIVNDTYSVPWHIDRFAAMAQALAGTVETCMIAFLDLYDKTRRNFPQGRRVTGPEKARIAQAFLRICRENDIRLIGCYEDQDLAQYGVDVSGCMTHHALEHAGDIRLTIPKGERSVQKSPGTSAAITQAQRRDHLEHGGCILGNDIGAYNTCPHGCKYCYANYDQAAVAANCRRHDPASPYLVGGPIEGEVIHQARQVSWIDRQLSLF